MGGVDDDFGFTTGRAPDPIGDWNRSPDGAASCPPVERPLAERHEQLLVVNGRASLIRIRGDTPFSLRFERGLAL